MQRKTVWESPCVSRQAKNLNVWYQRVAIYTNQSLGQSLHGFLISCNKNAIFKRGGEPKSRRQWAIHVTAILWESNIDMENHQITLLIGKSFIYHHYQIFDHSHSRP